MVIPCNCQKTTGSNREQMRQNHLNHLHHDLIILGVQPRAPTITKKVLFGCQGVKHSRMSTASTSMGWFNPWVFRVFSHQIWEFLTNWINLPGTKDLSRGRRKPEAKAYTRAQRAMGFIWIDHCIYIYIYDITTSYMYVYIYIRHHDIVYVCVYIYIRHHDIVYVCIYP
jgi:hypothetical protein